ncbi:MAG: hypothetical protein DME27_02870 [Verrucomicrobia bacterium]|nr:MAG: hypothetical protein DME27_02870 [Verrucomicrobiota bacterium]
MQSAQIELVSGRTFSATYPMQSLRSFLSVLNDPGENEVMRSRWHQQLHSKASARRILYIRLS